MSLRANRLGIRSIRAAMESLGVNKHDDVNDDTPREFDPNAGKKPEEIDTVKKVGEIEVATPPKSADIISQEDLEQTSQDDSEQAQAAKQGTGETGELEGGVSEAGEAAVVNEAAGPEVVEEHTDTPTGQSPVEDVAVAAEAGEDPVVSAAIAEGEVTTDAAEAAQTGEVAVTPDPADPVETNDNDGQALLTEEQPADPVVEDTVTPLEEIDPVVDQIKDAVEDTSDEVVTPEELNEGDLVLEQSIESLSSDLRLLTKISRKSGSMESYAAEAISDTIAEKFGKFWEWIKTQMRRISAYLKSLFERVVGRVSAGAEKVTVATLRQAATSKLDPERSGKFKESQQFKSLVASLNSDNGSNPAFDFVTRGDVGPINELIKAFEAVAQHQQLIGSINKILANGDPKALIEQDFFGKNASEVAALNAATHDIFANDKKTGSSGTTVSEDAFFQTLTRYPRVRVGAGKADVLARLVAAANKVRAIIPQAVSDRGLNTFMSGLNENPQEMADVLQNAQMGLRNYYRIIGGISLLLKSAGRAVVMIMRVDSLAMKLYSAVSAGKLNFGKGAAAAATESVEENGETGGDPAEREEPTAATGGDPAGEVQPSEPEVIETVTEDTVGVIEDPSTEMDEPIEAYNETMENVEEAIKDLGFVEREIERVKDSLEEGGLNATDAERLEDSMEGIARRHKLSFTLKMPSMESFQAGPATRIRNTERTLEGLEEFGNKLKEVIIKAAQYVAKLFEEAHTKALELTTNLRKDFAELKTELAKTEFTQDAQSTLESASMAKRLVVGDVVPSSYLQTLKTVTSIAVQLGNSSSDIRNGEFLKKIGRTMQTGAYRPTELAESLMGISKVTMLRPSSSEDGNVEYTSPVLFGNKAVKIVIPDTDWDQVDVSKLSAGVVSQEAGAVSSNAVSLPGKTDALAIANYGKTLDEAMQNMRVRASELKQIAAKARAFSENIGETGSKGKEDDAKQVSISGAKVISFTNRLVGLAGQPMLDYNRYLILLGRDLSALLRATIKAQKAASGKADTEAEVQAA